MSRKFNDRLRGLALGAAFGASALAVGAASPAQALPLIIGSISVEVTECSSTDMSLCDNLTISDLGTPGALAFEMTGADGVGLVSLGNTLSVSIEVTGLNGFEIDNWIAVMLGQQGASLGENISDTNTLVGLGFISLAGQDFGSVTFSPTGSITLDKDMNGTDGAILFVLQGTQLDIAVPAPAALGLFGLGLAGLLAARRRAAR